MIRTIKGGDCAAVQLGPPDVAPVVQGLNYKAQNAPASLYIKQFLNIRGPVLHQHITFQRNCQSGNARRSRLWFCKFVPPILRGSSLLSGTDIRGEPKCTNISKVVEQSPLRRPNAIALDFRYIVPFWKEGGSKASGVKIETKFSTFCIAVQTGKWVSEIAEWIAFGLIYIWWATEF